MSLNLGANPRYSQVDGAPFQPGQLVTVVSAVDTEVHDVSQYIGRRGVVTYLEYDCGSGQTFPHDPMMGVRFLNLPLEEFWPEELRLVAGCKS